MKDKTIILPGDKGWNDNVKYPWNKMRKQFGMKEKYDDDYKFEIHGYFVRDDRLYPSVAIFRNCSFPLKEGVPMLENQIEPFQSVGEAYSFIKSLNLSSKEESRFQICALAPDPGIAGAMPDTLFVTKDELKK